MNAEHLSIGPFGFSPDHMSNGPMLPQGWDGNSWVNETTAGSTYHLRAWNFSTGEFTNATASRWDEVCQRLRSRVSQGNVFPLIMSPWFRLTGNQ